MGDNELGYAPTDGVGVRVGNVNREMILPVQVMKVSLCSIIRGADAGKIEAFSFGFHSASVPE